MVVIDSRGPLRSLTVCEDWTRHLELSGLGSEQDYILLRVSSSCLFSQTIAHHQQCVERDQPLVVEYRPDPAGNFPGHLLFLRSVLARSCQQIDNFVLRTSRLAGRKPEYFPE